MIPIGRGAGPRKVLVSEELAAAWMTRTADGWRLSVEWGEPDDDGFYTPTFTQTDDGFAADAALGAAWRRCEAVPAEYTFSVGRTVGTPSGPYVAVTDFGPVLLSYAYGPTPTAALEALAEKLESLRP